LPTASILVGRFCGPETFGSRPDAGIKGRVGPIVADCTGWVLMGPVAAGLRSIILQERFRGGLVRRSCATQKLEHAAFGCRSAQLTEGSDISSYGGTLIDTACFIDGDGIFARSETVTIATEAT
jgi:hypothetical protein